MKNFISILIFTIFFANLSAQNSNYHWFEKDGKLYYNRNMPVYFWISTTPNNNSGDVLMTSHQTKKYANPMNFDTEGYNTLQTAYAVDTTTKKTVYPPQHAIFKIYVDGYEPTVNARINGTRKYINGEFYYKKGIKISFYAKDFTSGVENIYFAINNDEFQVYQEPVEISLSGSYTVKYYAIDNTGNQSKIKTLKFSVE